MQTNCSPILPIRTLCCSLLARLKGANFVITPHMHCEFGQELILIVLMISVSRCSSSDSFTYFGTLHGLVNSCCLSRRSTHTTVLTHLATSFFDAYRTPSLECGVDPSRPLFGVPQLACLQDKFVPSLRRSGDVSFLLPCRRRRGLGFLPKGEPQRGNSNPREHFG